MILQPDVAFIRSYAAVRLKIKFPCGCWLTFGIIGYLLAVYGYNSPRAIQRDLHGIPFRAGFAWFGKRLGKRIQGTCYMVFVFFRCFGMIIYLHFVAVENRHPLLARLNGYADKHTRVTIELFHFIHNADNAIAEFFFAPVLQAHTAMAAGKAVFYVAAARANVLPAIIEVFTVKELSPAVLILCVCVGAGQ